MASSAPGPSDAADRKEDIDAPEQSGQDSDTNIDQEESEDDDGDYSWLTGRKWRQDWPGVLDLEEYEFSTLDLATKEMRFLILEPHLGKPDSSIRCTFSLEPLDKCKSYTYVVNTRGNPFDAAVFVIDDKKLINAPNIWIFLHHIRDKDEPKRFWFRDICLNPKSAEERAAYWTQEWMDTMIQHAEHIIDLSEVITTMWDEGKLTPPFPPRPKEDRSFRSPNTKIHTPIPISLAAEIAKGAAGFPKHTYLPLDYVANEIRMITLAKADNYTDRLECLLGYNPLNNDVSYNCLSYMWGNEEPTHELDINGQKFMIRKSLDTCLRILRKKTGYIRLWIDAVCINQANLAERNRQLPRILRIYEDADVVACWAGEPDACSDLALSLVEDLMPSHFVGDIVFEIGWLKVKDNEDFPRRLAALYQFLCRPYFRRIWVAQEMAASRRPYVFCGTRVIEWKRLDHATWKLMDILYSDKELVAKMQAEDLTLGNIPHSELSFARRLFYLRHLRDRGIDEIEENRNNFNFGRGESWYRIPKTAPGILDVVTLCRDYQSTVPQDKVFAIWNLAMDTKDMEFSMNYSNSLAQTWIEFALAVANKSGSLDIVCEAEPIVADGLDLPSWCPDWSTPATVSSMVRRVHVPITLMRAMHDIGGPIYSASGTKDLIPRFSIDGSVLECAGTVLDTVGLIGPYEPESALFGDQPVWDDWMAMAAGAVQSEEDAALPIEEQQFPVQFWAMLSGKSEDTEDKRIYIPGRSKTADALTKSQGQDVLAVVTKGRCLIITEGGLMGLAPHYVEEGAKIAILSCCSAPVLLYENGTGSYRLGGSVFVQGWMRGEMLKRFGSTDEEAWEAIDKMGRLRIV